MVAFEDFALDRVDDGPRDPREFVALLDELASAIEMGLWEWNVVTGAVWWSRGLFGIYGRAPPLGPPQDYALPHVHEQDRERVRAAIERSLAEGPYYARYRLIREDDGELRELEAFGRTFFSDGAPQRFIGVVFDVTTRARARELAEFRARLLDAVGQAVLATDSAGMIQYANLSCTRMFGWEPEQLIGLHIARSPMAPPSVREQVSEILETLLAGSTWRGELLLTRKDGTRFPALVADSPVLDAQGEVTGMIGVAADITAQKRSELAARSAERLYRALFESPGQLIGLIELDGTVLMLNAQGAARLRVPPAEAIGRRLAELTPWAHELMMPRFAEVLARGESMVFEDTLTRAGELRYYVTNVMPVDIGERTVMQCVTSDISELRRAELALRESERQRLLDLEEFRAMFTSAPAMIHTVDADWRLTMVSDHWLDALGYTRAEVIGRRSFELLTPASRETARRLLPEFLATGAVSDIPHQIYKKSGEVMDVLLSATAERDARGRLTRSFAVLTDMTTQRRIERERLQLTQQLEHAQKLESLGVLAGGIAHD
ncbi:MAG: PAS domain S-box protein, partial [Myxococcales bacterium]|nr:PAS domain S-box protein [Myxococcales bacterium]